MAIVFKVKPWYKKGGNPDDYFDPVTHIATEENFIKFLNARIYTADVIGYKVILSQSSGYYNDGTWVIADVNHDSSQNNSYDLIAESAFYARVFTDNSNNKVWRTCSLRTWLNNDFCNGFSANLKSHMLNIRYDSDNNSYNDDKVILPSFIEINGSTGTTNVNYRNEGTQYPIFTDNDSRKKKYNTTNSAKWWTRSINTYNNEYIWCVVESGGLESKRYSDNSNRLAPVIRTQ